jgi:hypothetical protein
MSIPDTSARTSRKKRSSVSLDKALEHRLFAYAAAASAAGVAAISLAQPCHAQIVYTKAKQYIDPNSSYSLDLNNDGVVDFTITNTLGSCNGRFSGPSCYSQNLWVHGAGTNQVWDNYLTEPPRAWALAAGNVVGAGDNFLGSGLMDKCKGTRGQTSFYGTGSWIDLQGRYLGLAFSIDGQTHYGWARLNSQVEGRKCKSSVLLTGYAYETVPGKPIEAGQVGEKPNIHIADEMSAMLGTLGKLALGIMPSAPPDSKEVKSKASQPAQSSQSPEQ